MAVLKILSLPCWLVGCHKWVAAEEIKTPEGILRLFRCPKCGRLPDGKREFTQADLNAQLEAFHEI